MNELTEAQQIAQHYKAALDSVALINDGKPEKMEDSEWQDCLARNKEHLKIMLAKDYWTTEDLTPLETASNA
jgi:predicted Zn-dependent protease